MSEYSALHDLRGVCALRGPCVLLAAFAGCVLLAACASPPPAPPPPAPDVRKGSVVLLPEADGRPTAVTVSRGESRLVLDRPYAAASVGTQAIAAYQSSQQEVEKEFGAAIAAQPARAATFVLYFVEGKDDFTDDSKRLLEQMRRENRREEGDRAAATLRTCGPSDAGAQEIVVKDRSQCDEEFTPL